jgi:hypothetical protein
VTQVHLQLDRIRLAARLKADHERGGAVKKCPVYADIRALLISARGRDGRSAGDRQQRLRRDRLVDRTRCNAPHERRAERWQVASGRGIRINADEVADVFLDTLPHCRPIDQGLQRLGIGFLDRFAKIIQCYIRGRAISDSRYQHDRENWPHDTCAHCWVPVIA